MAYGSLLGESGIHLALAGNLTLCLAAFEPGKHYLNSHFGRRFENDGRKRVNSILTS